MERQRRKIRKKPKKVNKLLAGTIIASSSLGTLALINKLLKKQRQKHISKENKVTTVTKKKKSTLKEIKKSNLSKLPYELFSKIMNDLDLYEFSKLCRSEPRLMKYCKAYKKEFLKKWGIVKGINDYNAEFIFNRIFKYYKKYVLSDYYEDEIISPTDKLTLDKITMFAGEHGKPLDLCLLYFIALNDESQFNYVKSWVNYETNEEFSNTKEFLHFVKNRLRSNEPKYHNCKQYIP